MKKIFYSLLIFAAGILVNVDSSSAANISFTPIGSQLDNPISDPILDIEVAPGQILAFDINVDTNNIVTNPPLPFSVSVEFTIDLDPNELTLVSLPSGTIATATGFRSQSGFFQSIQQNTQRKLTTFQVKATQNIVNDALPDVTLGLTGAFIGGVPPTPGAQDVTSSFTIGGPQPQGAGRIVSIQPCPPLIPKLPNSQDTGTCSICGPCSVPESSPAPSLLLFSALTVGIASFSNRTSIKKYSNNKF